MTKQMEETVIASAKKRKQPQPAQDDSKKSKKRKKNKNNRKNKSNQEKENVGDLKDAKGSTISDKTEESVPSAHEQNKKRAKGQKQDGQASKKKKKADDTKKNDKESNTEGGEEREVWSKSKKKRMRKLRAKQQQKNVSESDGKDTSSSNSKGSEETGKDESDKQENSTSSEIKARNGSSLQKSYAARLSGSRFRILNEELYTTTSSTAFDRFQTNPELYDQYHEGFRHQVESWPFNPVDVIYRWITKKYASESDKVVVADFGCGDAELGKRLLKVSGGKKKDGECPFEVHSFDLVASCDIVTAYDMANVPLKDKSVDVGIFCLALMGTNVGDFLREAHRVLKSNGRVKVAEVRSRFESTSGKDELDNFIKSLELLGFDCVKVDRSNKMFVLMELKKNSKKPEKTVDITVKPCIYKRR